RARPRRLAVGRHHVAPLAARQPGSQGSKAGRQRFDLPPPGSRSRELGQADRRREWEPNPPGIKGLGWHGGCSCDGWRAVAAGAVPLYPRFALADDPLTPSALAGLVLSSADAPALRRWFSARRSQWFMTTEPFPGPDFREWRRRQA